MYNKNVIEAESVIEMNSQLESTQSQINRRLAAMVDRLKEKGYRLTPQRMAVLKILASSREHPSIESIYEQVQQDFPMTSLATIYKTVAVLKDVGEVSELNFGEDYSRFDAADPHSHPHLICVRCKRVLDIDITLQAQLEEQVSRTYGYKVLSHRIDFFGLCPDCQETEKVSKN